MSAPVSRRWQTQPAAAACTECDWECLTGSVAEAAAAAVSHALMFGHEVRVTSTRLIIITPRTRR